MHSTANPLVWTVAWVHHLAVSIWVRACCVRDVEIDLQALAQSISRRWQGVASELKTPSQLPLLRIQPAGEPGREAWLIHHGEEGGQLHLERWSGKAAQTQVQELLEELEGRDEPGARRVREVLARTVEMVGLEVRRDSPGPALSLALAAAAYVAEHGKGLVHADGYGWAEATPASVELLIAE